MLGHDGLLPDDVQGFIHALRALGATIGMADGTVFVHSPIDLLATAPVTIHIPDGAAPARFLLALAATLGRDVTVTGGPTLSKRATYPLLATLGALGARVSGGPGLPAVVGGPAVGGRCTDAGGTVSSQFLSALLLVGAWFDRGIRVPAAARGVSDGYVELTLATLRHAGIDVRVEGRDIEVPPAAPSGPLMFHAGGDWSGAAPLLASAAFLDEPVTVAGLDPRSSQPDVAVVRHLRTLGLSVVMSDDGVTRVGSRAARRDLRRRQHARSRPHPRGVGRSCARTRSGSRTRRICATRNRTASRISPPFSNPPGLAWSLITTGS
jgi:3-phosphoshikimate 1-carboxyvinyltransferase